jgi:hypothetical protein
MTALILVYYIAIGYIVGFRASNTLLPIIPLILILAAIGFDRIIGIIRHKIVQVVFILIIVTGLVLPLVAFSPANWGLYSSIFVGGTNNAFKLYPVGSESEPLPQIANYLNSHSKENSTTAIMAYDWTLKKYLNENRTAVPLFIDEGIKAGIDRKADYLVVPRIYFGGTTGRTVQELIKEKPIEIIKINGIELARIYKVDSLNK